MKLKQRPDDFRVTELTDVVAGADGEFALYRLDKTGWTTPDALHIIRTRWKLDARRVSAGGLKDRHAVTSQHVTVYRGPTRGLTHERLSVSYLGQCPAAFTSDDIRANRFGLTLRALSAGAVRAALAGLAQVERAGVPNYFDDQRFGSVGGGREFVGREMVLGRFERALWLALAAPYEFDRASEKREKGLLRDRWGDWAGLRAALPPGPPRSAADYLAARPGDFRGAVARLRPDLQGLYLAAYQSDLWNRMLATWLRGAVAADALGSVELKLGPVPVPVSVPPAAEAAWFGLSLPLPSARLKPDAGAAWAAVVDEVLRTDGLTLPELKVKGMDRPFFSKGDRAGCVRPARLVAAAGSDERNPGGQKLELAFDLPRGSYATILVKRLTAVAGPGGPG